jgi:hypothetical protein
MRFAEGSKINIAVPTHDQLDSSWMRWLMIKRVAPDMLAMPHRVAANDAANDIGDMLGRPVLPSPPFKLGWAFLAAVAAAGATLLSALPG